MSTLSCSGRMGSVAKFPATFANRLSIKMGS